MVADGRFSPPMVGSAAWDEELTTIGVDRGSVDRIFEHAVRRLRLNVHFRTGHGEGVFHWLYPDGDAQLSAVIDAIEVDASAIALSGVLDGRDAGRAAAWILRHQRDPDYATLMHLRLDVWLAGDEAVRAWITRQFAAMLVHGPEPVRASAKYGLWVDYFEGADEAAAVWPRLLAQVPPESRGPLLAVSGPVAWSLKRDAYRVAAADPRLHDDLARALVGCFYDLYGDVDGDEAADLFARIAIVDDDVRQALQVATSQRQ